MGYGMAYGPNLVVHLVRLGMPAATTLSHETYPAHPKSEIETLNPVLDFCNQSPRIGNQWTPWVWWEFQPWSLLQSSPLLLQRPRIPIRLPGAVCCMHETTARL